MKKLLWLIPTVGLLAGCGTYGSREQANSAPATIAVVERMPVKIVKLSALGYGNMGTFEGYTPGQRRLMAMRAAKLDAYRALAEQVHGVRVTGNSTVAAMVSQNDSFRVYVDAYVRGAKVASITPMAEGNYETVLELELGGDFFENFKYQAAPTHNLSSASFTGRSAVGPGGAYSSNFTYYSE